MTMIKLPSSFQDDPTLPPHLSFEANLTSRKVLLRRLPPRASQMCRRPRSGVGGSSRIFPDADDKDDEA